jgi:hypothetical protein
MGMVSAIRIEPWGGVVSPLTAGERFCRALDYGMWEEADRLIASLTDADKKYLIAALQDMLRKNGYIIAETEHPYPDPKWYMFSGAGSQRRRLFLEAIPELIQWSQECSLTKTLLGVNCLYKAMYERDYETVRLIVSLDPQAVLRRGIGGRVALHYASLVGNRINIVKLIHATALKAVFIRDQNNRTPLDYIDTALAIETNPEKREKLVEMRQVLENQPSRLWANGLSAARVEQASCPLRSFVLSELFEPRVLRSIFEFLSW